MTLDMLLLLLVVMIAGVCSFSFDFWREIGDVVELEVEQPRQVLVFIILDIICETVRKGKNGFNFKLRSSSVKLFKRTARERGSDQR